MSEVFGNSPEVRAEDYLKARGDEGINLAYSIDKYLDIVRNNKLLIAGVLALAAALGLTAVMLATPQFRSTVRVEISLAKQNVTNVQGLEDEAVFTDRAYLPTQYELLESHSLAMRVVRELDLRNDEPFLETFDVIPSEVDNLDERIVEILFENIEISPIRNSFLVDVSFSSPSPQLSARVANAWADAYIEEDLNRQYGATIEAREFLEDRLQQTRQRLESAERELIAYATQQGLLTINPDDEEADSASRASQTLVATELAAFNRALLEATADRIAAEAAMTARTGATAGSEENYSNGVLATLRERRSNVQTQLAELTTRFQEGYPLIPALRAQLAEIDEAIAEEQQDSLARLRADFEQARMREAQLQREVSQLQGELISQRQDSVQYNILAREVDTNRELYSGLLQRFREIGVVGVGESNVVIVDEARPANEPYSPNIPLNMAISLVLGIVAVGIGIYFYDVLNQSLRNPSQVRERLGLQLLGSIPKTPQDSIVEDLGQSYTELYESYFSVTAALANASGGSVPRSTMLTSSRAGEGKSLSSVALAYLLARQGKRVLLLDADLRNSGMGKYISLEQANGLTQYLQGNDDWRSMICQGDKFSGFDIIPVGRKSLNVAELLSNTRFQRLLDETEAVYDHVVVDGPPVLGLVDAPLIAASLEGVLLVIEANEGKWRFIENALLRLKQSNASIVGAIVTKLDDRNATYGYGYGSGYGYGYGSDKNDRTEELVFER